MDGSPPGSFVHRDSPDKNTGVGCHALLQGIFPTQGFNPGLPHCKQILYHLSHQESPSTALKVKVKSLSCVRLFATPWTKVHQAPPSMGFSRQEYWSGLPFPSPGNIPDPGLEPRFPSLQADTLTSEPPGNLATNLLIVEGQWHSMSTMVWQGPIEVFTTLPFTLRESEHQLGREKKREPILFWTMKCIYQNLL